MKYMEPLTESYFYILLCLYEEPRHGYGIMRMAEMLSVGRVKIGSGTMYGATGSMLKKGWIEECPADAERRRMYRITDEGRKVLESEIGRLRQMLLGVKQVMGGTKDEASV